MEGKREKITQKSDTFLTCLFVCVYGNLRLVDIVGILNMILLAYAMHMVMQW